LGAVLLIQFCNESPLLAFVVFVVVVLGGKLEFFFVIVVVDSALCFGLFLLSV
jgi:hypothetical protein